MKVQRKLALYLFPLLALLSFPADALAKCTFKHPGPACQEYWRADAVFTGVATRVVHTRNNTGVPIGPYVRTTVYFSVDQAFKGVSGKEIVMFLDHCGFLFQQNERYLVYASRNPDSNKLEVREGNTRTQLLSSAYHDLRYIQSLQAQRGSTVFGRVVQYKLDIKETNDTEPLANIKIILEGNNQRREVGTDSEGRYAFEGVQAGTYRIRAELPAHLRHEEQTVTLTGRECFDVDISATRVNAVARRTRRTMRRCSSWVTSLNRESIFSVTASAVSESRSVTAVVYSPRAHRQAHPS